METTVLTIGLLSFKEHCSEMRALHIAHYFLPHMAAGVTTREMIKMHLRKGHEVTLIVASTYFSDDLRIHYRPNGLRLKSAFTAIPSWFARRSKFASMLVATAGYLSVFVNGFRTLKREGPFNVIIVQYHPYHLAPLASYFLSTLVKTPFVILIHDVTPSSPTKSKLERFYISLVSTLNRVALPHAARILCSSIEFARILTRLGLKEDKLAVFPNTVDMNLFSSVRGAEEIRNLLKLGEKKVVLFLASAFEARGLDVLLRAFSTIKDERIVLVVVGPYNRKYNELAERLQLHDRLIFAGQVDYELIPAYIHMADVCVGPLIASPYTYGTVPRKVIEYMACGKPVIVAKGAVTEDLVANGKSAVLVGSSDEKEVAHAIILLLNDDGLSKMVGNQARRIIVERYSTENLANTLDETLKGLTCSRNIG